MRFVRGFTPTAAGPDPTSIVAITRFVEPSITDTVFALKSATYARFVRALTPIPLGPSPTSTVAITWGRAAGADAAAGADTAIAMQIASGRIANRRGLIADRLCRVIDLELLDDYVLSRPVLGTRRSGRDGLDHVHPFDHLAEDRVLAVQPRRGGDGDEELRPVRVRPGVGHGQEAGAVERRSVRRALVLELIPGAAAARSLGVPALDHEIGDDAVKDRAVVQGLGLRAAVTRIAPLALPAGQLDEVRHGGRGMLRHEANLHCAHRGGEVGGGHDRPSYPPCRGATNVPSLARPVSSDDPLLDAKMSALIGGVRLTSLPDAGPGVDPFLDLAQSLHQAPHHGQGHLRLVKQEVLHLLGSNPQGVDSLRRLDGCHALLPGDDPHLPEEFPLLHVVVAAAHVDLGGAAQDDVQRIARFAPLHDGLARLERANVSELQDVLEIVASDAGEYRHGLQSRDPHGRIVHGPSSGVGSYSKPSGLRLGASESPGSAWSEGQSESLAQEADVRTGQAAQLGVGGEEALRGDGALVQHGHAHVVLPFEVLGQRVVCGEPGGGPLQCVTAEVEARPELIAVSSPLPPVRLRNDGVPDLLEGFPVGVPHPGRGEGLSRLEVEVEARGVDVAADPVAEVEAHVDLVGALVLGEPHVAVDAEQRASHRAVVGHEVGAELPEIAGEGPHELQGRLLHHVLVPRLVLGEPGPVVVLAQVLEEPEQIGGEEALAHGGPAYRTSLQRPWRSPSFSQYVAPYRIV